MKDECRVNSDGSEISEQPCPHCGTKINAATCLSDQDARPSPGDIGVCYRCGEIWQVSDLWVMVRATQEHLALLTTYQWEIIRQVQEFVNKHNSPGVGKSE
jgi:hypothetical protein